MPLVRVELLPFARDLAAAEQKKDLPRPGLEPGSHG